MSALKATLRSAIRGRARKRVSVPSRCVVALRVWIVAWASLSASWLSPALAEGFAVPTFAARDGFPAPVAGRFMDALRAALAAEGVRVTGAPLVTAGIAGSLEPAFGELVAQIEGTRYAVLGEFVVRDAADGPFAVDLMAVDAVGGRATDLVSRAFGLATVEAMAVDVALLLAAFAVPAATLATGDAGLFVSTQPIGAEVRVGGVAIGVSGALDLLGLAPGRYEVEVRLDGYLPEVRMLDLRAQDTRFLHVVLTEITGGSLQVVTRPTAEVWLAGVLAATTPATLTTRPGDQEVERGVADRPVGPRPDRWRVAAGRLRRARPRVADDRGAAGRARAALVACGPRGRRVRTRPRDRTARPARPLRPDAAADPA